MKSFRDTREVIISSDSAGEHYSAAIFDPHTGSVISTYKSAGVLAPRSLQVLGDSYILGADVTKPYLHIWSANSQAPLPNVRLSTPGRISALACPPNGLYIVTAVDEKLYIWQTCTGRLLRNVTRHYQTITCLKFNKDGSMFASGAEDGFVFVWSFSQVLNDPECKPVHMLSNHTSPIKDIYFGHFGYRGRLCTVSLDRTANIYEAVSGTLLLKLICDVPLTSVTFNILETDLFIGSVSGTITRFNLQNPPRGMEHHLQLQAASDKNKVYNGHTASVVCLSVSVDCRILLSASLDKTVNLWDIPSGHIVRTILHKGPVTSAFFTKRHINFQAIDIQPTLKVASLQRVSGDKEAEDIIEIVKSNKNTISDYLNFESYVRNDNSMGSIDESSHQVTSMNEEIDKLKNINLAMYRYNMQYILGKETNAVSINNEDMEERTLNFEPLEVDEDED